MQPPSRPQYAAIETPFGVSPPKIYCPICGKLNLTENEEYYYVDECDHMAFAYSFDSSSEMYESKEFAEKIRQVSEYGLMDVTFENIVDRLIEAGYGNNLLAIEITHGKPEYGPFHSWRTDVLAYDFSTITD